MIEEYSNLENGSAACTLIFFAHFSSSIMRKEDKRMILLMSLIGLGIGGALVAVCGKVVGNVVDDTYHDLVDNFKGIFRR